VTATSSTLPLWSDLAPIGTQRSHFQASDAAEHVAIGARARLFFLSSAFYLLTGRAARFSSLLLHVAYKASHALQFSESLSVTMSEKCMVHKVMIMQS